MALWSTTLRIDKDMRLLVRSPRGDDLIKARLPIHSAHPRALLTMLEGIALYSGEPICAAISATAQGDWLGAEPWGEDLWPGESQLVQFDFVPAPGARRRLRGVGDFRDVRQQLRLFRSR